MTEEEVYERLAARVRIGYERIWKPCPEIDRLLELAPTMQDEVFEKCAEAIREIVRHSGEEDEGRRSPEQDPSGPERIAP